VKNATIKDENGFGIIKDNDDASFGANGYVNQDFYFGYDLAWSYEFDGAYLTEYKIKKPKWKLRLTLCGR